MARAAHNHPWDALARALASESPDIVLILSPDGVVQHASAAAAALFRQPVEGLIGQSVIPHLHPDDLALAVDTHVRAIRGELSGLVRYRVRDGLGAWRWLEVSKQPLRDPETGKVPAVFEIARDVTEGHEVARQLRESEARLRMAQRVGHVGSWELELATGAVTWSDEMFRLIGLEPGTSVSTLEAAMASVVPEDRPVIQRAMEAAERAGAGREVTYQIRMIHADGTFRTMDCFAARFLDPERGALFVGVARDVTEAEALRQAEREAQAALERARDEAEAASCAKSLFLANMSHELRTPLNAIIGYAELIGEEAEDLGATALMPDLVKVRSAAHHLLALINDVLDLAKIEAGGVALATEDVDVAELVEAAVANVEPLARANGNAQEVHVPAGLAPLHADGGKVRQCLTNLLANAHKFTHGGRVTIAAAAEPGDGRGWLRFDITDTGIGIGDADQARVFEEFVQAEEGTTRRFGGTGLGLPLVRAYARAMGGEVTLASAPGEGTAVTLRLPVGGGAATG